MRNRIVKIETNFFGKNKATKLGIEPATFRTTAKHATYCATEATSSYNLKFFIIFSQFWQFCFSSLLKDFWIRFFLRCWGITKLSGYVQINSLPYWEDGEKLLEKLKNSENANFEYFYRIWSRIVWALSYKKPHRKWPIGWRETLNWKPVQMKLVVNPSRL